MKKILLGFLMALQTHFAFSTHITGGDFSVRWISGNDFEVTLHLFRDYCNGGAALDNPITITVFDNVTNAQVTTFSMSLISETNLTLGDECYSPPANVCISDGFYRTTVTLPNNPNGYYFAWERCCRNNSIVNLNNPGNAGMVFYVQIPDPVLQNSTPVFGPYPTNGYLCIGTPNILDFGVTEADGDSLVYLLETPYMGSLSSSGNPAPNSANPKPYALTNWQAPYNLADIVGGTPPMTINPQTGIITCQPAAVGVYAFAVMIHEYRNGIKISETRREIQYYALNCVFDDFPEIFLPDTVNINVLSQGCFDIVVADSDIGDTVSILLNSNTFANGAVLTLPQPFQTSPDTLYYFTYWDAAANAYDSILLPESQFIGGAYINETAVGLRYCWQTDCNDLGVSGFELEVSAYSLGCSGDTNFLNRTVVLDVIPPSGIEEIVPNVFSPNNDGVNDTFHIEGTPNPCWDHITVQIYNRWGQLVYESDQVEFTWDGKNLQGKDLPQGTYFVLLTGVFGDKDVTSQYPVTIFR